MLDPGAVFAGEKTNAQEYIQVLLDLALKGSFEGGRASLKFFGLVLAETE